MELMITTNMAAGTLPEIQWNNEELKAYAIQKAEEYKSIAYTEDDKAAMKKDRADLNRFINAVENERKNVKKFYAAPYEKFETQVKEVLQPLRGAVAVIDKALDEVEQRFREERALKLRELYEKYVGSFAEFIPFERTADSKLYLHSKTDKNLEQYYIDFFGRVKRDMAAIDALDEKYQSKVRLEYTRNLNLSDALAEGKRLEMLEQLMKKQQEERQQEAEAAAKRAAEAAKAPEIKKTEEKSVEVPARSEKDAAPIKPEEPVYELNFRVRGTREQLMALKKFMNDNHITFGKVE